jgi:hypothetical protein
MAFEIDREMRELATEIAKLTGESEEEAVRRALRERRERLSMRPRRPRRPRAKGELLRFMETEIWSQIPDELLGQPPMTKEEKEELLGYGPEGF